MAQFEQSFKCIRCLQVYIMCFNVVNRAIIFTWKLLSIGLSIISGYAAIAHFKDHPIFGIMYYVTFIDSSLSYILVYGKGVRVPQTFSQATNQLRLRLISWNRQRERAAILVCLNDVVVNIVNMLVAFT